jgi:hypothetical protein
MRSQPKYTPAMKKSNLFLPCFVVLFTSHAICQEPVVYPDAIPKRTGSNTEYLTMEPFNKVRAYYVNFYGSPDYEETHKESGANAQFLYEDTIFEPRGIYLTEKSGNARAVNRVFSELKGLMARGVLEEAEYNVIEKKYIHLKDYYYLHTPDERGKLISADEAIYGKYFRKLGAGGTEAHNIHETMAEAQALIMSGKIEEGKALMENMKKLMIGGIEHARSPQAVESWIECLEEINACKFPVKININR